MIGLGSTLVYSILVIHIYIPFCRSLKEKRSQIKPLIHRIHNEFNVSVSEIDKQDTWNETVVACALISNNKQFSEAYLARVIHFIEKTSADLQILEHSIQQF